MAVRCARSAYTAVWWCRLAAEPRRRYAEAPDRLRCTGRRAAIPRAETQCFGPHDVQAALIGRPRISEARA